MPHSLMQEEEELDRERERKKEIVNCMDSLYLLEFLIASHGRGKDFQ